MIRVIGLHNDPTVVHFLQRCGVSGVEAELVDLCELVDSAWIFPMPAQDALWRNEGKLRRLPASGPYYVRLIDLSTTMSSSRHIVSWQALIVSASAWLETIPGIVVNRPGHAQDNASKPLHEALLSQLGFLIPPALTSSDRMVLAEFASRAAVVKTVSGVRADCWSVSPDDFARYDATGGPVHLQRTIAGIDVRAHVVGHQVIAASIDSHVTDYRMDENATYTEFDLPFELRCQMTSAAQGMGLHFSGWDFKVDRDGTFWLLEVNPMPGYNSYDRRLGGRITDALIGELRGQVP